MTEELRIRQQSTVTFALSRRRVRTPNVKLKLTIKCGKVNIGDY